jgi:hypothetical protein
VSSIRGEVHRNELFSKILHYSSWVVVFLCVLATALWVAIVVDGNYCWSAFAFMMIGGNLIGFFLILLILPSALLYHRNRQKRDLWSLWLAGSSALLLLVEIVLVMWIIPQRGE